MQGRVNARIFPSSKKGRVSYFVKFFFSFSFSPFLHGYREGQFGLMILRQGEGDGGDVGRTPSEKNL